MEKQKRWQFYLILAVILLTLYNIMPTVFYYTKPLKSEVGPQYAEGVSHGIVNRVDSLEDSSVEWLNSFSKLLGIKPSEIKLNQENPRLIEITFKNAQEAQLFQRFLPRAGSLIPFVPAQLALNPPSGLPQPNKVLVSRQINVHLNPQELNQLFTFSQKMGVEGKPTDFYRDIVNDRVEQLALGFGGPSRNGQLLEAIVKNPADKDLDEAVIVMAGELVEASKTFAQQPQLAKRYFADFIRGSSTDSAKSIKAFQARLEEQQKRLELEKESLEGQQKALVKQGLTLEQGQEQQLQLLERQSNLLRSANLVAKKNMTDLKSTPPLSREAISQELAVGYKKMGPKEVQQVVSLQGNNPFVEALVIDWTSDKIFIRFYDDVEALRSDTQVSTYLKDKLNQYLINTIATASQFADEKIEPSDNGYALSLSALTGSRSFLVFNLNYMAEKRAQELVEELKTSWNPTHQDLARSAFPIYTYGQFNQLPAVEQRLGLVVYTPVIEKQAPPEGFHTGSIYVVAKGLDAILQNYRQNPENEDAQVLFNDVNALGELLTQNGFISYPGSKFGMAPEYSKDYIFEQNGYYNNLLKATREDFHVKGSKRYAVLEFTDVEQRILALNAIDDREQEDLLKWNEAYHAAQVDLNPSNHYQVPAPTANPYWENFKLSFKKYFRGDDRKILKWGLDLSGGKTVRIGLRDRNNRPVTDPEELKQAVNQLYVRVNNMGVSERTIHIENNNIILDFPGSQNLSASDLVKASAMYFHIVNEKFTPANAKLKTAVDTFLQNVWNEAVVTNQKDVESINEIAWQHLGAENDLDQITRPRSEAAQILYENGLRLANPTTDLIGSTFNDTLSAIGRFKGDDFSSWEGQAHPLIFLFHNYALEGASLADIHTGYDTMHGHSLTFNIKRNYEGAQAEGSPREDLYTWTSQFAADKIVGTTKEAYTHGRGWRMAVILNGSIISSPNLNAALRDSGTITGRFSQREVNQLAADLKAGSLSFTPRILSEQNVSPELGAEERTKGIVASLVALLIVVVSMVGYYRFAGIVASVAVLFNILIMWGILQNLGAALSLPTIAGIVLTIAMAIDANVLVFERIREEFALSGRIASAIQIGYRKAFSAIIDSNITTIIAALILTQFDSGPIKGFAVALIVGIVSSMFTSLFMTRYFFAGWVQNPKNKALNMSQFFNLTHFDFLGQTRKAFIISGIVMFLGATLFMAQKNTMFGMDFTGGYAVPVEVLEQPNNPNYRLKAMDALIAAGASQNDVLIRELSQPNQLRIQLGMGMEEPGHPFYQMTDHAAEGQFTYGYQENPRLVWLVNALAKGGLSIPQSQLKLLDKDWTVMSGQISETMRNNALMGMIIALICILVYITLRFEFKYAIGAVVGLVHDVIITLGILAFFHWIGFPVQIDLQVVGALMTIIGYSLNDTIIVFDRIREDVRTMRKLPFRAVVSHALNVTLSRTVMTSGTTMLVLLALVFFGGQSIFAFSLVMAIGVAVGTISSLYIASPVMLYFHDREQNQESANGVTQKA